MAICSPSYDWLRKDLQRDLRMIRNIEARKKRLARYKKEVRKLKDVCKQYEINLNSLITLI